MPLIKPKTKGHIIEVFRYRGQTYQRRWKRGYFEFDFDKEIPLTDSGEVIFEPTSKRYVLDVSKLESFWANETADIAPKIDMDSKDFKDNYNSLYFLIVGGYHHLTTTDDFYEYRLNEMFIELIN